MVKTIPKLVTITNHQATHGLKNTRDWFEDLEHRDSPLSEVSNLSKKTFKSLRPAVLMAPGYLCILGHQVRGAF